jgi:putative transposase
MQLNNAGEIVKKWWLELKNKFPQITLDESIIMPNHFHGIIQIVGADLCVCPVHKNEHQGNNKHPGAHIGAPLQNMIQWFKTMVINEYIRHVKSKKLPPFEKSIWQRNYYEHIIRNENELNNTRKYILNNPVNWKSDELFLGCKGRSMCLPGT